MLQEENSNLKAKELIEPMIFFSEGKTPSNPPEENPNLEAKELIEPMIFFSEGKTPSNPAEEENPNLEAKELIEPMIFFSKDEIPSIPPQEGNTNFEANTSKTQIVKPTAITITETTALSAVPQTNKISSLQSETHNTGLTSYKLMEHFLSQRPVIIVNDTFYVFDKIAYFRKNNIQMARLVMQHCRGYIKNSNSLIDVVRLLMREPTICVEQLNIPKNFVSFKNCVLNTSTRKILEHSPALLTLYNIEADFLQFKNLSSPIFDEFIFSITGGDSILAERIYQSIGYLLTPDSNAKCFFLLQGVGDSGKSVFANFLQSLFNDDSVVQLESSFFGEKFTMAELVGKSLCYMPDIPPSPLDNSSVSRLKLITGNDRLKVHKKNEGNVDLLTSAKFVIATNHPLLTKTKDNAFFNRVITIPFKYAVPPERRVLNLQKLLSHEKSAVVTKAILAYFRLVDNNYIFAGDYQPNEIVDTDSISCLNYRYQILKFTKDHFVSDKNGIVFIEDAYNLFCKLFNGISKNDFSHYFQESTLDFFDAKKDRKRKSSVGNPLSCMTGINFKKCDNELTTT